MRLNGVIHASAMALLLILLPWPALAGDARGGADRQAAGLKRIEETEQAPELAALGQAWERDYRAARRAWLENLAASGQARDLFAAAALWPADGDVWPAAEARHLYLQASRAMPRDALVDWAMLMRACGKMGECDRQDLIGSLLSADPDNAEVHLLAFDDALARHDDKMADAQWRAAAAAPFYRSHFPEFGRLLLQSTDGMPLPPLPSALAKAQGALLGLGRDATPEDMNEMMTMGVVHALAMPAFKPLLDRCPADSANLGPERRDECVAVLGKLAADDAMLIVPLAALSRLIPLLGNSPQARPWRERLRDVAWAYEKGMPLTLPASGGPMSPGEYTRWWLAEGELPALREVLRRNGAPVAPPPDWLPSRPRQRQLITGPGAAGGAMAR